jgi:CubicO group peptidase (beta-lactamase class C family)
MKIIKTYIKLMIILYLPMFWSCTENDSVSEPEPPLPRQYESKLATLLDSLRYNLKLPALAGAIIADTGIIDAQAVGCRRYGGSANVTVNDQFHLGSDTKAFTAVLMGKLVDEGLLGWDYTLAQIFPEYAQSMRSEYLTVNLKDILSHSAGFCSNPQVTLHTTTVEEQRREIVAWALQQPPATQRGHYSYSNLGYIIAGAIVDKVTDSTYEDLLFSLVLQPLDITTAGFGPMGTPGLEDQPLQHADIYHPLAPDSTADNPPIYNSAGRLHMSIGDWGRYIQWVLACEAGHSTLVQAETARMLTTAAVSINADESYALGWAVVNRDWAGGRTLTHSGSNTFNYAVAWLAPNLKFGVIAATNICTDSTPAAIDKVAGHLINFYFNLQ